MSDTPLPPRLPLRLGGLLVAPLAALRGVERRGGGVRDALWLVAFGIVVFRLEALAGAAAALVHATPSLALAQAVAAAGNELNEAAMVVVPAAVLVTLLAGRRRDPGLDLELGAACYPPFFAARVLYRMADAVVGPLPAATGGAWFVLEAAWALAVAAAAVRVARERAPAAPTDASAPSASPAPAEPPRRAAAIAAGLVGLTLAIALSADAISVVRRGDAFRPLAAGAPAPNFVLPRIDGVSGNLELASMRGQVVLLDFWATWCSPCLKMIPLLHAVHEEWRPRGVQILGVNSDADQSTREQVRAFVAAHPAPYPHLHDDGRAAALYRVTTLPHLVLIGRGGDVRRVFWGSTTKAELAGGLERALADP